jgi:hypothetical protein
MTERYTFADEMERLTKLLGREPSYLPPAIKDPAIKGGFKKIKYAARTSNSLSEKQKAHIYELKKSWKHKLKAKNRG